jgi:release factor glutamine methyltransferase
MNVRETLQYGYNVLKKKGIETPFLDATLLLGETLKVSKEQLFSSFPESISKSAFQQYESYLEKRIEGAPISYIRRRKEFYSLEFYVDNRVFVPRADTELVIDTVLHILKDNPSFRNLHDVCTGSGCIAITLKHNVPSLFVSASDISAGAGEVFAYNSLTLLNWIIPFYVSNLLEEIAGPFDVIVSNPPYLSEKEVAEMRRIRWPEPETALHGGEHGLDLYAPLIEQSIDRLQPNGYLVLEAAPEQMETLKKMMEKNGFININIEKDLAERNRVIWGHL